jgi:hypothetical protein
LKKWKKPLAATRRPTLLRKTAKAKAEAVPTLRTGGGTEKAPPRTAIKIGTAQTREIVTMTDTAVHRPAMISPGQGVGPKTKRTTGHKEVALKIETADLTETDQTSHATTSQMTGAVTGQEVAQTAGTIEMTAIQGHMVATGPKVGPQKNETLHSIVAKIMIPERKKDA